MTPTPKPRKRTPRAPGTVLRELRRLTDWLPWVLEASHDEQPRTRHERLLRELSASLRKQEEGKRR